MQINIGGFNVSRVDEQLKETKGKRSITLAVTMVLLVMSLMLVVVFASKNIGHTQHASVAKGKAVVEHFEQLKVQEELLLQYMDEIQQYTDEQADLARLTAAHSMPVVIMASKELNSLIELASQYDKSKFNNEIPASLNSFEQALHQLQLISSGEGALRQEDYDQLKAILDAAEQRYAIISTFNFNVSESKNALIRIGNGFDWIELVEGIEQQLNIDVQ